MASFEFEGMNREEIRMMTEIYGKYQDLANQGNPARLVYLSARSDGLDFIGGIKVIRHVFGLSPVEAKEIAITADGKYASLSDYQETLIPSIQEAFEIAEQEDADQI